jgi:hypothetical protein
MLGFKTSSTFTYSSRIPRARHTRNTTEGFVPNAAASDRMVHRRWSGRVPHSAAATIASIAIVVKADFRPRPGASRRRVSIPQAANRSRHTLTVRAVVPSVLAISEGLLPAAAIRTIRDRSTSRNGAVGERAHRIITRLSFEDRATTEAGRSFVGLPNSGAERTSLVGASFIGP